MEAGPAGTVEVGPAGTVDRRRRRVGSGPGFAGELRRQVMGKG